MTYAELAEVLDAVEGRRGMPSLNRERDAAREQARPGSTLRAIAAFGEGLRMSQFTWGFSYPQSSKLIFNTRLESALEGTPLWADAIRDGRCILPVASFFEPHRTETAISKRTGKKIKRQYRFASSDNAPLLLAGIQQAGRLSVVTTEPNASVSRIHDRMPLVLRFEEVPTWLEGDYASLADRPCGQLLASPEHEDERPDPASQQLSLF